MQYTAKWGSKGFLVSTTKIVPLMDLKTTVSVKSETQNDTSGTAQTNITGKELQPVNLSTIYMAAAGVDPRAQLKEWEALVGKSNPLIIGGKRFGPKKMMLKSVSASEILTNNDGKFIKVKIDFTFEEYPEQSATSVSSSGTSSNSSANKAADTYAATVEKKKALTTGASKSDKATKKSIRKVAMK